MCRPRKARSPSSRAEIAMARRAQDIHTPADLRSATNLHAAHPRIYRPALVHTPAAERVHRDAPYLLGELRPT
jgi:hypothetical protein